VQPLDRIFAADARSLVGLCFDVDDTVTTHGTLDPDAYRSLFALRESGLRLIAATGRPLGFAEIIARTWPVDAAVGENGAGFIARVGKLMRTAYWDPVELRVSQQVALRALRARVERELPHVSVSSDGWARRCDLAFDIGEHVELPPHEVEQLVSILGADGARVSVSSIHAHAQLGTHDKARGIELAAAELWGMAAAEVRERFFFVGDSGNDAAGFSAFALSAGVANVARHLHRLPVAPKFVASREFGAGFAEIAARIVALRGGAS